MMGLEPGQPVAMAALQALGLRPMQSLEGRSEAYGGISNIPSPYERAALNVSGDLRQAGLPTVADFAYQKMPKSTLDMAALLAPMVYGSLGDLLETPPFGGHSRELEAGAKWAARSLGLLGYRPADLVRKND